jgi:hypothetical protein
MSLQPTPKKSNLSAEIDRFLALGGEIKQLGGPVISPYLESTRRPLPEWEAAKVRRAQRKSSRSAMYTTRQAMAELGLQADASGYRRFKAMLDGGELPCPDQTRSVGDGKSTHWWLRERFDAWLQMRKIARRHA